MPTLKDDAVETKEANPFPDFPEREPREGERTQVSRLIIPTLDALFQEALALELTREWAEEESEG